MVGAKHLTPTHLRPGAAVVSHPPDPNQVSKEGKQHGDNGHEVEIPGEGNASEEMGGGIKGCEAKWDDPAQHELDEDIIDRQRVAAEGKHVEDGRDNPYAVFKPKRN